MGLEEEHLLLIQIELLFIVEGFDEKAVVVSCSNEKHQFEIGKEVVAVDSRYFRPTEVDLLIGDQTRKILS